MTRKQLEDLEFSKEEADSIMKINGDDIENLKSILAVEKALTRAKAKNIKAVNC